MLLLLIASDAKTGGPHCHQKLSMSQIQQHYSLKKPSCLHCLISFPSHEHVHFKGRMRIWPGPASSSRELFWPHLWELMTERPYTCCSPPDKSSLLSGSEHPLCKLIQEEEPRVKKKHPLQTVQIWKGSVVVAYHHKFKYFCTRLVSPYKGKATPLWELQLMSANSSKG